MTLLSHEIALLNSMSDLPILYGRKKIQNVFRARGIL
jgi:hypothetical protein